jgi:hypothetical protein
MRLSIILGLLMISYPAFSQFTDSFIVDVSDRRIKVTSPLKKIDIVSIIIRNRTFEKVISELRSDKKVLKRFVLKPEGKEVIQVNFSKVKALYYVPVSPPFEAVELMFKQRPYEIPPKKQKSKKSSTGNK